MTFQSLEYMIFLPVVFILYWTLCRRSKTLQNGLIVAASLVFYGWWDWKFLLLIALTTLCSYGSGLLIVKACERQNPTGGVILRKG